MKFEWTHSTIGEVCTKVTDGSHFSPKSVEDGKYMVSVKDFTPYGFDFSSCRQISNEDYEKLLSSGCVPEYEDILVGKDGARYFEDIIIYRQQEKPALLSSIAILRCNKEKILPEYLYYLLKTPAFKKDVKDNYGSGSAIPRIILKDFKRMPITYPSLDEQKQIVSILTLLDRKIELNNKINDNLEQQTDLIYANVFCNELDFCELGNVVETTSGGTPSRKHPELYENPSIYWVKSKELNDGFIYHTEEMINETALSRSSAKMLPSHSVLVAMYGATVGEYGIISSSMTCNQAICALIPNDIYSYPYLYELIRHAQEQLKNLAVGSAQQNISQVLIKKLPIHSNAQKIQQFTKATMASFQMREVLAHENFRLAKMRDTLLPKLMTGEIEV